MTREEAIECLNFQNEKFFGGQSEALKMAVEALKNSWNPLGSNEEGMIIGSLPEEGEEVLVTVYGQVEIDSFGCDVEYDESVGECRNEWFCENNDIEDVKAWMPKPAPYKGKVDKGNE